MGVFDSPKDAPFQIKTEGENISLNFSAGKPVTGQGTVDWNIPAPAHGCQADDGRGVYCGMVVLLHTKALQPGNAPVDGEKYTADPTADFDAHAGDKIDGALVVGAFYEGEKRSRGEDLTTSFTISDVAQNGNYYVAGYAVDCQGRYHREGVRAYSDLYAGESEPGAPSTQVVTVGSGILPTDGTGLVPGLIYEFEVEIDPTFPQKKESRVVKVSVDGLNVSTYDDLVNEINKAIALADNPLQSPVPLNSGRYYWDAQNTALFQWDGSQHNPVVAIIEDSDPATPTLGDYWYDTANELLYLRAGSPDTWNAVPVIEYIQDPRALQGNNDFWFNGTNGYKWCGTTWCEKTVFNQNTDPSEIVKPTDCGHYWFDESNEQLLFWNTETCAWEETFAIMWDVAPNLITNGTYWFDSTNNDLFVRDAGSWSEIIELDGNPPTGSPLPARLTISEEEPEFPIENLHWYKTSTEQLFIWDESLLQFEEQAVLTWPDDPTDTETCDLWWDTTTDTLYLWDTVNNEWDEVLSFTQSPTDPFADPTIEQDSLWYNPDTEVMLRWDGTNWVDVAFVEFPTDPTQPSTGVAWFNPSTGEWAVWDTPTVGAWNTIDPIGSESDPFMIPSGTLWFDTANNVLFERSGTTWIATPVSMVRFTPKKGELWFDTSTNILKKWDGEQWVDATVLATAWINSSGNIVFQTTFKGSNACVMILVPEGSESGAGSDYIATGTASFGQSLNVPGSDYLHDFIHHGVHHNVSKTQTSVTTQQFLFDHLMQGAQIRAQTYGIDGLEALPSYDQIGVGDDGSPDEKRELADSIRSQLGYPTIDVELTPYQINTAIDLALESLRKRSSAAYQRGFFFLDVQPGYQHFKLTDKTVGFHKIVTVMSAYRFTSAFLSSAHGAGVYGQVVLQHLYNMGTFDLLSFHLVSQYIEQMEHLFATRLTYHWDETSRTLAFYHSFTAHERILLDVTVERTDQEIMKDRWTKTWVERYAYAESMRMLAQIRGKYASLPGAGGGIALNAADLMSQHDQIKQELYQQIDDFIVNDVEDIGQHSTFIIG